VVVMEPGRWPQWRPLKRHDSHVAEQMVERAAELARDSHARTRHAAVLIKDGSMLGWGTNGVPFPGEDHCYCKLGEFGHHDMCRTHAEQRAITLAREGDGWRMLPGSKLIYVRLEADDSVRLDKPHFCPRCSRLALSLGVAEWIFALSEGLAGYSCADYDTISQLGWLPTPPGPTSTRHTGPTMTIKPDLLTTTRATAAYGCQLADGGVARSLRRAGRSSCARQACTLAQARLGARFYSPSFLSGSPAESRTTGPCKPGW
jgi:deoxycytidylate deaminase